MTSPEQPAHGATYQETYRRSIADPRAFWAQAARHLHWYRSWDRVLDDADPRFCRWFPGGLTNLCFNAVDRHVLRGAGDRTALIWDSPSEGRVETITYSQLLRRVTSFAAVLRSLGVQKGDRVAIYLPMVPEAAIAMLACARIGAIHVVVFTGYGADALACRMADSKPKVLVTTDAAMRRNHALPLKRVADQALEKAPVEQVIVLDRGLAEAPMQPGRDHRWAQLERHCRGQEVEPIPLESGHASYILYTALARGGPGGVVRDTGGSMVALHSSMRDIFDAREGDVFWAASDVGWVVGHSYTVYGPLLRGITSVMFEGTPDYPDHSTMWRVLEKHGVTIWFTAPTALRMLRRFGMERARATDLSRLRYLFLAGEILDEPTWQWSADAVDGRPVIDNYWLTETGAPVIANPAGIELLPGRPGSPGRPVVGYDLRVVGADGEAVPAGTPGLIVALPPLPPGNMQTLWHSDERYVEEYWSRFPGRALFAMGDRAAVDEEGYIRILGRADDILNVAAHRLSIGEIEGVLSAHPSVADVCVVGVSDAIKGEEPVALIVLKEGYEPSSRLRAGIKNHIRESMGAVAAPRAIRFVPILPRTADGRVMRHVLRALCEKREVSPAAIAEDGAGAAEVALALNELAGALA